MRWNRIKAHSLARNYLHYCSKIRVIAVLLLRINALCAASVKVKLRKDKLRASHTRPQHSLHNTAAVVGSIVIYNVDGGH